MTGAVIDVNGASYVRVDSWKLTLPCTRAEAEAIDAAPRSTSTRC